MPSFKIQITLFFTVLLLLTLAVPVFAATYTAGVTTGQYVKYGNFVGNGPGLEDFGNIDSQTQLVTNVAGTQVTLLSTGQYKNGTATQGNGTTSVWDVAAGTNNGSPETQGPIIAANLNAGDAIPPQGTYSVNSTETRQYLGSSRTVNILNVDISTPDYNTSLTYVYDRASGMLLEANSETSTQSDSGPAVSQYSYSVTETNIFNQTSTPPNSSPMVSLVFIAILVVVVLVVVVLVVVLVIFRKRL